MDASQMQIQPINAVAKEEEDLGLSWKNKVLRQVATGYYNHEYIVKLLFRNMVAYIDKCPLSPNAQAAPDFLWWSLTLEKVYFPIAWKDTVFWVKGDTEDKSVIMNVMFETILQPQGTSIDPEDCLDEVMAMAFTFWKD